MMFPWRSAGGGEVVRSSVAIGGESGGGGQTENEIAVQGILFGGKWWLFHEQLDAQKVQHTLNQR